MEGKIFRIDQRNETDAHQTRGARQPFFLKFGDRPRKQLGPEEVRRGSEGISDDLIEKLHERRNDEIRNFVYEIIHGTRSGMTDTEVDAAIEKKLNQERVESNKILRENIFKILDPDKAIPESSEEYLLKNIVDLARLIIEMRSSAKKPVTSEKDLCISKNDMLYLKEYLSNLAVKYYGLIDEQQEKRLETTIRRASRDLRTGRKSIQIEKINLEEEYSHLTKADFMKLVQEASIQETQLQLEDLLNITIQESKKNRDLFRVLSRVPGPGTELLKALGRNNSSSIKEVAEKFFQSNNSDEFNAERFVIGLLPVLIGNSLYDRDATRTENLSMPELKNIILQFRLALLKTML